ncbi:hypothetical protein [Microbispora sp. NPDC049633]|uniref:hypothetical protein n=1 Tax=Microbispora sp. NPDC049633 TaxID=3154355 RepID=UPI00343CFF78
MSYNQVIYKLEQFGHRSDDRALQQEIGFYSSLAKAKKGLRAYLTDTCRLTIEETGLDAHATMLRHVREGERKNRALLADDGETAYFGEFGIGIFETPIDEDDDEAQEPEVSA